MIYLILSYLTVLVETICCILFYSGFCQWKNNCIKIKKNILLIGLSVFMCAIAMFFSEYFVVKEVLEVILITIFMWVYFDETIGKIAIISIIYMGILNCSDYMAVVIDSAVRGQTNKTYPFIQMLLVVLSKMLVFTIVIVVNRVYGKKRAYEITKSEWAKFTIFPTFSICIITCLVSDSSISDQSNRQNLYWIIAFGLLGMNIVIYFLLKDIMKREELLFENRLFAREAGNKIKLYEKIADKIKKQQALSHEYKNQIACIQALSARKEYDELDNYLNTIYESVRHDIDYLNANHVIVNAVLNEKFYESMNKNILFIFKINDLSTIWLDNDDIVLLLSNLLNNAIEACEKCADEKKIKVKFVLYDNELLLAVKNTYEGVIEYHEDYVVSTKNGDVHGYGMKNMIRIIKKYKGDYNITHENGEFSFVIMFHKENV